MMAGASVSPVVFAIMKGRRDDHHALECPFCCAATGTFDHVVWRCPSLPDATESCPQRCLAGTLRMDVASSGYDEAILAWHAWVRNFSLTKHIVNV